MAGSQPRFSRASGARHGADDALAEGTECRTRARVPEPYRLADKETELQTINQLSRMYSSDGIMTPEGPATVRTGLSVSVEKIRNANIDLAHTYTKG